MTAIEATIWSGVLSMLGGVIGATAAYCAASNTIKKQVELTKTERKNDILQKNIEGVLHLLFEIKYLIDFSYSKRVNTEYTLNERITARHTVFSGESLINEQVNLNDVQNDIKKIDYLMRNSKSKSKILQMENEFTGLSTKIFDYVLNTTEFNLLILNKKTVRPIDLEYDFKRLMLSISQSRDEASEEINGIIDLLDDKLNKLLN